jgi:hypothetical protein
VPCTEPHTAETVAVITLTEPTIAEARESHYSCGDYVRGYLGVDLTRWVPWGAHAFMPSRADVADGASWLRCDAVFPRTWSFAEARTTNVAAEGLADAPPDEFWACLDAPPAKQEQPFVSCNHPHAYEQTGTVALLDGLGQYPSAAKLAAEGRQQCRKGVRAGQHDVSVTAAWDPPKALKHGSEIVGACFMFSTDGQRLPGRQHN